MDHVSSLVPSGESGRLGSITSSSGNVGERSPLIRDDRTLPRGGVNVQQRPRTLRRGDSAASGTGMVRCGSGKLRVGAQRSNSPTPRKEMVTRARFERATPSFGGW